MSTFVGKSRENVVFYIKERYKRIDACIPYTDAVKHIGSFLF